MLGYANLMYSYYFQPYISADEEFTLSVTSVKIVDGEMVINGSLKTSSGESVSQKLVSNGLALSVSSSKSTGMCLNFYFLSQSSARVVP